MPPPLRRFMLTVHVTASVGWVGAILAYLALNVPVLTGADATTVRAAYLMMEPVIVYGIVPLALTSLVTGLVQSLGTPWGLFRHYWVVISLVFTVIANLVLIGHVSDVRMLADMASDPTWTPGRGGDMFHTVGGLIVVLVPLWLNMYKPRGLTRYGWRQQQRDKMAKSPGLRGTSPSPATTPTTGF